MVEYSSCPVCYKAGNGSNENEKERTDREESEEFERRGKEVQLRFFKLFGRYLNRTRRGRNHHHGARGGGRRRMEELLFPLLNLLEMGMNVCVECLEVMEEFSELYHRLRTMELELKGKVWKLKSIMEGAQHPSPRRKYFEKCAQSIDGQEGGSGIGIADSVFKSKEALIQKCSEKLASGYPKLPVVKLLVLTPIPQSMGETPRSGMMMTTSLISTDEDDNDDNDDDVQTETESEGEEDSHAATAILEEAAEAPNNNETKTGGRPPSSPVLKMDDDNRSNPSTALVKNGELLRNLIMEDDEVILSSDSDAEEGTGTVLPSGVVNSNSNCGAASDGHGDGEKDKNPVAAPAPELHPPTQMWKGGSSSKTTKISLTPLPPKKVIIDEHAFFRLKCPDCQLLFKDMKAILTHRKTTDPCKASYDPSTSVKVEVLVPAEKQGKNATVDDSIFTTFFAIVDLPQAIFTCEDCGVTVYASEDMESHQRLHNPYPCPICDFHCPDASALAIHSLEHNKNKKKKTNGTGGAITRCPHPGCRYVYATTYSLPYIRHYLEEHLGLTRHKPIFCPICKTDGIVLMSISLLAEHLRTHHDLTEKDRDTDDIIPCSVPSCNAYFLIRQQLKTHLARRHNIQLTTVKGIISKTKHRCRDCERCFNKVESLRDHRLKHHVPPDQVIPCEFPNCPKVFEHRSTLQLHMLKGKELHEALVDPSKSAVPCPKCEEPVSKYFLLEHLKRHQGQGSAEGEGVVCELCGKVFKRECELQRHHLSHEDPESWSFSCEICGKRFPKEFWLNRHLRMVHVVRTKPPPPVCELCGKMLAHRGSLQWHLRTVHGKGKKVPPRRPRKREAASITATGDEDEAEETDKGKRRRSGRNNKT